MISKKGAIEMSMTTIIVIVLGVTLLILGLTFVRSIFTKITDISQNTFDEAEGMMDQMDQVDQFLTINPERKDIEKGKDAAIKVIIKNFEEESITVTAKSITKDKNLVCKFFSEGELTNSAGPYTIESGGIKNLALVIKDDGKGTIRPTGCSITIENAPTSVDNKGDIIVNIIAAAK